MPVWQALYEELKDRNFILVAVAFDTGGADAVRTWIRPAVPIRTPRPFRDMMGWSEELYRAAAVPAYPCLIDEKHVVAELYDMRNVPMGVWIDEGGRIVRPAEPAGATDGFRALDRTTLRLPPDAARAAREARERYVAALRDWVLRGAASPYALPEDAARARITGPSAAEALAAAHFRLGQYLFAQGHAERARAAFAEAGRLAPERWHYFRQGLDLQNPGDASGPAFAAAVAALGDRPYYPAVELEKNGAGA